ncbi:DUF1513 domain-containing protein [Aquabacterium sp. CECT 9606]|uniref:DUF1513 domain-containing protein n=1 Tax=Aquabacterium sp. CECT 9606 TaxID=2845822 RepID=UPI001E5C58CB|nr:DUF1513 domain-containing protein [Aquabacterium sp. CECT 9606]CAH0353085.1 hypothetical protein AQB9606_03054 [Aquabacterium sp. CECT 9606]
MLRRNFLQKLCTGIAGCTPAFHVIASNAVGSENPNWPYIVGSWQIKNKKFIGAWSGTLLKQIEIPFRPHELLFDPSDQTKVIAIGRRPGRFIAKIDLKNDCVLFKKHIESARRFNGHAAFSNDGQFLYTSENGEGSGPGFIVTRRADTLEKVREYSSYGVGPHSIILDDATPNTIIVANGGLLAIPDTYDFREPIDFDSSLVRINLIDGSLIGQWRLEDQDLSIRHLNRSRKGVLGVALQAAHSDISKRLRAPVLAIFNGEDLQIAESSNDIPLNGYGGDITSSSIAGQEYFHVGCMHANLLACWDSSGKWNGALPLNTACAVKSVGGVIYSPTEGGTITSTVLNKKIKDIESGLSWDNHITIPSHPPI